PFLVDPRAGADTRASGGAGPAAVARGRAAPGVPGRGRLPGGGPRPGRPVGLAARGGPAGASRPGPDSTPRGPARAAAVPHGGAAALAVHARRRGPGPPAVDRGRRRLDPPPGRQRRRLRPVRLGRLLLHGRLPRL